LFENVVYGTGSRMPLRSASRALPTVPIIRTVCAICANSLPANLYLCDFFVSFKNRLATFFISYRLRHLFNWPCSCWSPPNHRTIYMWHYVEYLLHLKCPICINPPLQHGYFICMCRYCSSARVPQCSQLIRFVVVFFITLYPHLSKNGISLLSTWCDFCRYSIYCKLRPD